MTEPLAAWEGRPARIAFITEGGRTVGLGHVARCVVGWVGPRHASSQIAHDFPLGEAALDGRHVLLAQWTQDEAVGFEHRRRRHGWLGGRHVGSRFRFAGWTGPCAEAPTMAAGLLEGSA